MSSNPDWRIGSTTGLNPDALYSVRRGWAHPSPVTCPNGHRLGPNRVLVGIVMCPDVPGTNCHRTYTCRQCDAAVMWPPAVDACDHRWFDGR
ncbi:hypothetical protein [Nocardia sp. NPDC051833]|uniref:hypothetical protein n=1 Tax=Nocardia sp. NPDC051833 TaxID=3155674 RepID=UPI0034334761